MIKITDFIVKHLSQSQDQTGEYEAQYDFEFILSKKCSFSIFGVRYEIDRIAMNSAFYILGRDIVFANKDMNFNDLPMPKSFFNMVLKRLKKEEKDGKLKGWCFSDEVEEYIEEYEDVNLPLKAYQVTRSDEEYSVIVFAETRGKARSFGAAELDRDFMEVLQPTRAPWADPYAEAGKVPIEAMLEHGWWHECCDCMERVYGDDLKNGAKIIDCGPVCAKCVAKLEGKE